MSAPSPAPFIYVFLPQGNEITLHITPSNIGLAPPSPPVILVVREDLTDTKNLLATFRSATEIDVQAPAYPPIGTYYVGLSPDGTAANATAWVQVNVVEAPVNFWDFTASASKAVPIKSAANRAPLDVGHHVSAAMHYAAVKARQQPANPANPSPATVAGVKP